MSIPNGVDISKYKNAQPYTKQELDNIAEDAFVTTMVARFDYPKRQDTLVEAAALLPEKFHIVLVGGTSDDSGLQKVQKLAQDLGVSNRVHFLYLRSDVPQILKTSDVVVMSSEYEGLSLSSIEGMACGHPFIATNVNGLREVVGGAGELFECGNADNLAQLLRKFESDKDFYCAVTNKCLARAEEYDIQSVATKYQSVYNKFVKING
jgi:glycosyltransferase involved in cell wall biosynthesis